MFFPHFGDGSLFQRPRDRTGLPFFTSPHRICFSVGCWSGFGSSKKRFSVAVCYTDSKYFVLFTAGLLLSGGIGAVTIHGSRSAGKEAKRGGGNFSGHSTFGVNHVDLRQTSQRRRQETEFTYESGDHRGVIFDDVRIQARQLPLVLPIGVREPHLPRSGAANNKGQGPSIWREAWGKRSFAEEMHARDSQRQTDSVETGRQSVVPKWEELPAWLAAIASE